MDQQPGVLARTLVGAVAGLALAVAVIVLLATWDIISLAGITDHAADIHPATQSIPRRLLLFFPIFGAAVANLSRP